MKRINVWWLVGILVLLTFDWDGYPGWTRIVVGFGLGWLALRFAANIQSAIDHRKDT